MVMSKYFFPSDGSSRRLPGVCLLAAAMAGCASPPEKGVVDDNPSVRIRAIKRATEDKSIRIVKDLVDQLGDDDPAVRFYAIQGIIRITGEDRGFRYYAPLNQRQQAVERWKQWVRENESDDCQTRPTTRPDKEVSSW
jgi:hypothetical protein